MSDGFAYGLSIATPDRFAAVQRRAEELLAESAPRYPADPLMARMAAVLTRSLRASHVLELGGGAGYTGLHILASLGRTGRLETIEPDQRAASQAEQHFVQYGFADRSRVHAIDVRTAVRGLNGPVDLVIAACEGSLLPGLVDEFVRLVRVGGSVVVPEPRPIAGEGEEGDADATGRRDALQRLEMDDRFLLYVSPSLDLALATRAG